MRRIVFAVLTAASLFALPALAAYPLCSSTSSGLCQVSDTDGTVVYGCGNGDFVGSGCSTCDDACFSCSTFGLGCVSLKPDSDPKQKEVYRSRHEIMACMPVAEASRG